MTLATVVVGLGHLDDLTAAQAQSLAGLVGVGRHPAGRPGSEQRRDLAAALAATVLRRLARAAGLANRLAVTVAREPGHAAVTLSWPAADPAVAEATGAAVTRLVARLGADTEDGVLRRALREAGAEVAAVGAHKS